MCSFLNQFLPQNEQASLCVYIVLVCFPLQVLFHCCNALAVGPLFAVVQVDEGDSVPTGGPFAGPGQPPLAMSQGPNSASQLHPAATLAASAAMPLGINGWSGGQVPGLFGVTEGAVAADAPVAGQVGGDQGSGTQAGASVEREYTANGKRK